MGMRIVLGILVMLLSGCAHENPWTKQDTVRQSAVVVTMAYDAYLTTQLQYCNGAYESGFIAERILGSQPATSDTYQYFATSMVTSYLIARALPAKWRPYWQVFEIGVHGYSINTHRKLGCP